MVFCVRSIVLALSFGALVAFARGSTLALAPDNLIGGAPATATLTLDAPASGSGLVAPLASNSESAKVPVSIVVPPGQTSATFPVSTIRVDSQVQATITATVNGAAVTAVLTLNPVSLSGFSVNSGSVVGGRALTGTLTLTAAAGQAGVNVAITANSNAVTIPAKVTLPAGQNNATFTIQTHRVSTKTDIVLTASLGLVSTTVNFSVFPEGPQTLTLNPATLNGGEPSVGTVNLTGPAPTGGLAIALSSNSKLITIPATVKVEAAATSATFPIKTIKVSTLNNVVITAKYGDQSQKATLAVAPPGISTIVLNPTWVVGTNPSGGTITLAEPAPPGGLKIALSCDQPAATVPLQLVIPAGKTVASFTVKTIGVAAPIVVNVKAVTGNVPKTAPLTINAPVLVSLVLSSPVVDGGNGSSGIVTIGSPAPPAGLVVVLASNVKGVNVPVNVTIEPYHTSASFRIKTTKVTSQTQASITATFLSTVQTATLTVN